MKSKNKLQNRILSIHEYNKNLGLQPLFLINLLLPVVYLGILLKSIVTNYSNVPYWDEWDSKLFMNPRAGKIDIGTFWQQHNEHRIVWGKLLCYFDFVLFNGDNAPLIVIGVLIALAIFGLVLTYIWRISSMGKTSNHSAMALSALSGILLFSTMQKENFYWAFQGLFFLAIILPLLAIIMGYKFIQTKRNKYFVLSWLIAFASIGTLASGLLVSLCLILMNLIGRTKKRVILISVGLAISQFLLYFYNYTTPNSSPLATLIHHPKFIIEYVFLYLGNPTTYILNLVNKPLIVTLALVYVFITFSTLMKIATTKKSPINVTLIPATMSVYVLATATLSAGGRYEFGVVQATASRYTTMSLMGWCCIGLISAEYLYRKDLYLLKILPIIIGLLLLPQQTKDLTTTDNELFDRKIAAVALALDIKDEVQLQHIYPQADRVLKVSKTLIENKQSIFGESELLQIPNLIGKRLNVEGIPLCLGHVDVVNLVPGTTNQFQISGWIFQEKIQRLPRVVLSLDSESEVIGYGLTGMLRPDVSDAVDKNALMSGFKMYASDNKISEIIGFDTVPICKTKVLN